MTARQDHHFQQHLLALDDEVVVDLFAGGGGVSTGLEIGLQRKVDIAVNHNPIAIALHEVNHPNTLHFTSSVYEVCPLEATRGRKCGWLHASPDCTHFSQAKGGQPRDEKMRSLSWIVLRWAGKVRPRVVSIENVLPLVQWGNLVAKRSKCGRIVKLDGSIAQRGEIVPRSDQYLVPDKKNAGRLFRRFVSELEKLGYVVEWKELRAADFGAPTIRKRLFIMARCDGRPIVWPEATHASLPTPGSRLKPWKTAAADCIDWSIPAPSIFGRKKPLVDSTMRRLAQGFQKFVVNDKDPFIIEFANRSGEGLHSVNKPLGTITAKPKGGSFAICIPYLAQMNGGFNVTPGHSVRKPLSTITNTGSQQQLVTARLVECDADGAGLSQEDLQGASRVYAYLMHYYSQGTQFSSLKKPLPTITTRDRIALVVVTVNGNDFAVVDIGLRMLTPRELYRGQGFPDTYIIDRTPDGKRIARRWQVACVGNSVCPLVIQALAAANNPWLLPQRMAA